MNNCDISKGTSSYTLFTCIDHINQREQGGRGSETENSQDCDFHPLWKVDTMQTKVSVLTQILADNAYQPPLDFAHCGANLYLTNDIFSKKE